MIPSAHNVPAFLLALDPKAVHLPLALLLIFGTAKLFANVFERLGQPGLVGEVNDDVLGLLVLGVVSSLAEGRIHPAALLTATVMAVGFTLLVAKYGTRTLQRVMPSVEQKLSVQEGQFDLALVLLFGLAV